MFNLRILHVTLGKCFCGRTAPSQWQQWFYPLAFSVCPDVTYLIFAKLKFTYSGNRHWTPCTRLWGYKIKRENSYPPRSSKSPWSLVYKKTANKPSLQLGSSLHGRHRGAGVYGKEFVILQVGCLKKYGKRFRKGMVVALRWVSRTFRAGKLGGRPKQRNSKYKPWKLEREWRVHSPVYNYIFTWVVNLDKLLEGRDHVSVWATVVSLAQRLEHSRYLI